MAAKGKFGAGRSATRFSYTFSDLAEVAGMTKIAIQKHAQRGNFDPKDLISVLEFIQKRYNKKKKLEESLAQYPIKMKKLEKK